MSPPSIYGNADSGVSEKHTLPSTLMSFLRLWVDSAGSARTVLKRIKVEMSMVNPGGV